MDGIGWSGTVASVSRRTSGALSAPGCGHEHRQLTLANIGGASDSGRLVWAYVDNGWGKVDCHAVLVYGQRGNVFDVYSPELSASCLKQAVPP